MKRLLLAMPLMISIGASGCAAALATAPAPQSTYETMESLPPAPRKEDVPSLAAKEVWVPGYYEPVAGNWIWHQGEVTPQKDGYRLLPASYVKDEAGNVMFIPPRWRRADLQ